MKIKGYEIKKLELEATKIIIELYNEEDCGDFFKELIELGEYD